MEEGVIELLFDYVLDQLIDDLVPEFITFEIACIIG